jgi:hypothetical protein
MKVYFTASIVGKNKYLKNYEMIIQSVKKLGHSITAEHIINKTSQKISMETKEERHEFHTNLISWIKSADCMIVDSTFPSISVGYEISVALRLGKPILLLYCEGEPPSLLNTYKDEKIITEKYTPQNLHEIIADFMHYVEGASDLRFTFYITPSIALYLDKVSREKMIPKSVYIRRLIEKDMTS